MQGGSRVSPLEMELGEVEQEQGLVQAVLSRVDWAPMSC